MLDDNVLNIACCHARPRDVASHEPPKTKHPRCMVALVTSVCSPSRGEVPAIREFENKSHDIMTRGGDEEIPPPTIVELGREGRMYKGMWVDGW